MRESERLAQIAVRHSARLAALETQEVPTGGGAPATHVVLSATHTDTTAAAVVRGDVMTGQAGPVWARLAHPAAASRFLTTDANDVAWSANTFTINGNTSITGGGTLALGGFTLTVPESLTAAGRNVYNAFSVRQNIFDEETDATVALFACPSVVNDGMRYAIVARPTVDYVANSALSHWGVIGSVRITTANNLTNSGQGQSGIFGDVRVESSGTYTKTHAVYARANFAGAGATGTIVAHACFRATDAVNTSGGAGAITTQYGLLIDSLTFGSVNYAIYTGTGALRWGDYQETIEVAAPAAPAANSVRLFARDDGAGVTEWCARFATGDIIPIARQGITLQTYTPSNVTPDRSFDADTVAIAELADVVGTLIADLQAQKIIL